MSARSAYCHIIIVSRACEHAIWCSHLGVCLALPREAFGQTTPRVTWAQARRVRRRVQWGLRVAISLGEPWTQSATAFRPLQHFAVVTSSRFDAAGPLGPPEQLETFLHAYRNLEMRVGAFNVDQQPPFFRFLQIPSVSRVERARDSNRFLQ